MANCTDHEPDESAGRIHAHAFILGNEAIEQGRFALQFIGPESREVEDPPTDVAKLHGRGIPLPDDLVDGLGHLAQFGKRGAGRLPGAHEFGDVIEGQDRAVLLTALVRLVRLHLREEVGIVADEFQVLRRRAADGGP